MSKKLVINLVIIFFLSLNFVYAVGFDVDDGFTSDDSSRSDAKSFEGINIDFTIQSSDIMVACYDYAKGQGETPVYEKCFAANQQDFDDCEAHDSFLTGMGYEQSNTPETTYVTASSSWTAYFDARYYKNCDGSGGGNRYDVDEKKYWIFSRRFFDCDDGRPSWYEYDAEGYIDGSPSKDYKENISCPTNKKCSEDDDNVYVYTYDGAIPNPCRWVEWQDCNNNNDCWSDYCYILGSDDECSDCNKNTQCTTTIWNRCHSFGDTCCDEDPIDDQWYCNTDTGWDECTNTNHISCENKGSYYCSKVGGDWAWRTCSGGCSGGVCYGDGYCDTGAGETYSNSPQDCCDSDCSAIYDSIGHSACDGYNGCSLTSGCDGQTCGTTSCVDSDTYRTCCEGGTTNCDAGETCESGQCIDGLSADLEIIDIIPIQVIPNVDMVKGKSGFVRIIAINNGQNHAVGKVTVTFNGSNLEPYNNNDINNMPPTGENVSFDFVFKPDIEGENLVINASIRFYS
jgi:hypothetical protein